MIAILLTKVLCFPIIVLLGFVFVDNDEGRQFVIVNEYLNTVYWLLQSVIMITQCYFCTKLKQVEIQLKETNRLSVEKILHKLKKN